MRPLPPALEAKITGRVVRTGGQILVVCPAHDDSTPSLAIKVTDEGAALLTCHGGCDTPNILSAWGLSFRDIMGEKKKEESTGEWTPVKDQFGNFLPASAIYRYVDEKGVLIYEVVRVNMPDGKKSFRQRRPDATKPSGWAWNLDGTRPLLYRLPKALEAVAAGEEVLIVEGEKDVHTAESLGYTATCNSGGAGKFLPEFAEVFKDGAHVLIVADADEAGRKHARLVKALVEECGGIVRVAEALHGKDLTDHVAAGGTMADLQIVDETEMPDLGMIDFVDLINGTEDPYDWLVPGLLERGERCIFTGPEGLGKVLALETLLVTATGWTTMGEVQVGDLVIDRDGNPCTVTDISEVQLWEAHRMVFSDGSEIVTGTPHQWLTQTLRERENAKAHAKHDAKRAARSAAGMSSIVPRGNDQSHKRMPTEGVRTTAEIMATLKARAGTKTEVTNHSIAAVKPLDLPEIDLPVSPYLLGVWLGDGTAENGSLSLGARDAEAIIERIKVDGDVLVSRYSRERDGVYVGSDTVRFKGLQGTLRSMGLLGNKSIPDAYQRASFKQRLALLQGLMDTDGYAAGPKDTGRRGDLGGLYELTVAGPDVKAAAKEAFVGQVMELMYGLGILPSMNNGRATIDGRDVGPKWRITFQTDLPVFTVPFKAERMRSPRTDRSRLRYIVDVQPTGVLVPMKCISVDSPTKTYLIGDGMIPTHNTTFLRQFATSIACGIHPFQHTSMDPKRVVWFDAENSKRQNMRAFGPMGRIAASMGRPVDPGRFSFFLRPDGIDLGKPDDAAWFFERLAITKPDLVIIGPWYRLFIGNPNDEEVARKVVATLDTARAKYGFAVLIEAHSPHQDGFKANKMGGVRPVRPIGSSLLLRWPEYGYGLSFRDPEPGYVPGPYDSPIVPGMPDPNYADFMAWRGARDEREWPQAVRRSNDPDNWPWLACDSKDMAHPIETIRGAIERTDTYPKGEVPPNGTEAPPVDAWGAFPNTEWMDR